MTWFILFISHIHKNVRYVEEIKTIEEILEHHKKEYYAAGKEKTILSVDKKSKEGDLQEAEEMILAKKQRIFGLCEELANVCSRFNFVSELHANVALLEQMNEEITDANTRKDHEKFIETVRETITLLSNRV